MRNINEDTITQAVIARHASAPDARLREVMTSLVQHLHAFAREVRLSESEWAAALAFVAEAGRLNSEARPELELLSDVLGLSTLVAAMARPTASGCTESTASGALPPVADGEPCFVRGRVRSAAGGLPLAGAAIEVHPPGNRGTSAVDGSYQLRALSPQPAALPDDGPVGRLLAALGRHPWRPPHLQIAVRAPGHEPLVTQVFREGGRYLDSDAAFGVRESLVRHWQRHDGGPAPDGSLSETPFYTLDFEVVLSPARAAR